MLFGRANRVLANDTKSQYSVGVKGNLWLTIGQLAITKNRRVTVERFCRCVRAVIKHSNLIVVYALSSERYAAALSVQLKLVKVKHARCWRYKRSVTIVYSTLQNF